ncbi:MAG: hypothetical protein ACE5HX_19140 [bacterium]
MKMLWTGSDSLYLIKYPPSRKIKYIYMFCLRLFARLVDFFVQEHYADHRLVKLHLIEFGMKKPIVIVPDNLLYPNLIPKKQHSGFNVLYYFPKRQTNLPFTQWVYGYDIYEQIRDYFGKRVNWIIVNGDSDMNEVFPIVDFYLRPTRHDGSSRMRQECEINGIPYYWSQENPNVEEIKKEIKDAMG